MGDTDAPHPGRGGAQSGASAVVPRVGYHARGGDFGAAAGRDVYAGGTAVAARTGRDASVPQPPAAQERPSVSGGRGDMVNKKPGATSPSSYRDGAAPVSQPVPMAGARSDAARGAARAPPRSRHRVVRVSGGGGGGGERTSRRGAMLRTRSKWRMLLRSIEVGPTNPVAAGAGYASGSESGSGTGVGVVTPHDLHESAGSEWHGSTSGAEGEGSSGRGPVAVTDDGEHADGAEDSWQRELSSRESVDLATLAALDAAVDAAGGDARGAMVGGPGDDELFEAAAGADNSVLGVAAQLATEELRHASLARGPVEHEQGDLVVGGAAGTGTGRANAAGAGATPAPLRHGASPPAPLPASLSATDDRSARWSRTSTSGATSPVTVDALLSHEIRKDVWREAAASFASNFSADMFAKLVSAPTAKDRAIRRDVHRTFAAFGEPGADEDALRALRYMLRALSLLDVELGYCQGLNFVAALALNEVGEETGFWVLAYLMDEARLRTLYLSDVPHLSLYIIAFEEYMRRHVPTVRAHLASQGFLGSLYAVEWFTTLFACNLHVDAGLATVTMILLGVDNTLFRVGAAVLDLLRVELVQMSQEGLMTQFKPMALELDPRRVVERALSFPPQPDELQRIGDVGGSSSSLRLGSGTLDGSVDDTGDASGSGAGLAGGGGTKGAGWGAGSLRARRGQSLSADRLMRAHVGALWSRAARESILRHRHINYADLLRTASTTDAKIVLDVDRTSSSMRFGMSVSPSPAAKAKDRDLAQALQRVLHCVAVVDTEIGYCQGMNFVAQTLVHETGEERAFWLMLRLLQQHHLRVLYLDRQPTLSFVLMAFEEYIMEHCPVVARHLRSLSFQPALYAVEWFTTLFACNLPEIAVKCTISMVLGGWDNVLLRIGAAVLVCLRSQLLGMTRQDLLQHFKARVLCLNAFDVISAAVVFPPVDDVLALVALQPARARASRAFSGIGSGIGLSPASSYAPDADAGAGPPQSRASLLRGGSAAPATPPTALRVAQLSGRLQHPTPPSGSAGAGSGVSPPAGASARGSTPKHRSRASTASVRLERLYPQDVPNDYPLPVAQVQVKKPVQCKDCVGYVIQVTVGDLTWRRVRRYSEFYELHEQLRALNKYIPLPGIPPKVWFGSKEPTFIHERCRQLDMYLRALCACPDLGGPHNHIFVREFMAPAELGGEQVIISSIPRV